MRNGQAVAVIGAGASGLLTAIQILNQGGSDGPRIYLIEKYETFGAGAAYSTSDPAHLLNTRTGNMSGFPDKPGHFLDWLAENEGVGSRGISPACFVSRHTYGRYLRSILRDAATGSDAVGRFYLVPDEAVSVRRGSDCGFTIRLALGKDIHADAVVIAIGNPPPHPPGVEDNGVLNSPYYSGDPWAFEAANQSRKDGTIVLLGTGLTTIDFALSLARNGHRAPIVALSRRGLLPRRHSAPPAQQLPAPPLLTSNILADLKTLRRAIAESEKNRSDWRDVIDSLRPITAAYWQSLAEAEQQRFLRHLRPWWEVHRHRIAPEAADKFDALLSSGQMEIKRGRLKRLALTGDAETPVAVTWLPKGSDKPALFSVSRVVNCMGPGNNPLRSPFPLVQQMLRDGLLQPDGLGLGVAVSSSCQIISKSGVPEPALFALGPVTRGTFWEVTAIPDIRVQAASVAKNVLCALADAARTATGAAKASPPS
jgi:uncharacterized NAD(P)/FAD-binding protein YdhS